MKNYRLYHTHITPYRFFFYNGMEMLRFLTIVIIVLNNYDLVIQIFEIEVITN